MVIFNLKINHFNEIKKYYKLMKSYFKIDEKTRISPFGNMVAYLGGSAIQTIGDNPVTAYRQLVQQYTKDINGNQLSPQQATKEANRVFLRSPLQSSLSGLYPRLTGVLLKRIPKFGFFLGYDFLTGGNGQPGVLAATTASILSAPFINPVRMIEKQQRVNLRETGKIKPINEILRESKQQKFKPLFRGTIPLMGHSLASALLGLVGQPKLQKNIQEKLGNNTQLGRSATNLISSAIVSPLYVILTNPLSRLEVLMQTNNIKGESIKIQNAIKEVILDSKNYGFRGLFRGQGVGLVKAIISLSLFHEGRLFLQDTFKTFEI